MYYSLLSLKKTSFVHSTKFRRQERILMKKKSKLVFSLLSLDMALLGRSAFEGGDFGPSDEEILDQTQVRSFFPETWIYDEKVVG